MPLHPNVGGVMNDDIQTLQKHLAASRARQDRQVYTRQISENEVGKVRNLLRLLGFTGPYEWAAGEDPYHDDNHRVVFKAVINGHTVSCTVTYDPERLWDADDLGAVMQVIGDMLRRDVAFHTALAYREERDFVYDAIAMYKPGTPFLLAYITWRLGKIKDWLWKNW